MRPKSSVLLKPAAAQTKTSKQCFTVESTILRFYFYTSKKWLWQANHSKKHTTKRLEGHTFFAVLKLRDYAALYISYFLKEPNIELRSCFKKHMLSKDRTFIALANTCCRLILLSICAAFTSIWNGNSDHSITRNWKIRSSSLNVLRNL